MARVRMEGSTIVLQDDGHREVLGVVDVDGGLWLRDVPGGETLWNQGRYIGLRDRKIFNHAKGGRRPGGSRSGGDEW